MSPTARTRTVVVAGDLVVDVNLIRSSVSLSYHSQALPVSALKLRHGGAWYLRDVVERACADLSDVKLAAPRAPKVTCARDQNDFAQAFQVWKQLPLSKDKPKDMVWRIGDFLGCEKAEGDTPCPPIAGDTLAPAVLVIDDLGLGFAADPKRWPKALSDKGSPGAVVVKVSSLPDRSPFWDRLRELRDRVTIVLADDTLREAGARLSAPLSWDLAIEEITREFASGTAAATLTAFKRVIVRFGLEGAASFTRLGLCSPHQEYGLRTDMRFERFLYLPESLPGDCTARMEGRTFGANSLLAAALVRHELGVRKQGIVVDYPLFIALGRGLAAAHLGHEKGGGDGKDANADAALEEQGKILTWRKPAKPTGDAKDKKKEEDPAFRFFSAFDHDVQDDAFRPPDPAKSDLLGDVSGRSPAHAVATAIDVVLRGPDQALGPAPRARYGKYVTADREEIERINAVRNLIEAYLKSDTDKRPLSVAVFGPPGAGKSFAIKNLAKTLFPDGPEQLEFNLSQMCEADLITAFQRVRDASIQKKLPLVFWDEFDTGNLQWLRHFLAPMQDAEFRSDGAMHPLGKCIFVFAGGTCPTFDAFNREEGHRQRQEFVDRKGPDFVSRLRGYLNVKGPNPVGRRDCGGPNREGPIMPPFAVRVHDDPQYLIRRALILRAAITESFPDLEKRSPGELPISRKLVRAFLRAADFTHGARSINSIVAMSTVGKLLYYNASQLPAEDFVLMHSEDLLDHLDEPVLEPPVIEELARACHTYWLANGVLKQTLPDVLRKGYRALLAEVQSPASRSSYEAAKPRQRPYDELEAPQRNDNLGAARDASAKLEQGGYVIVRGGADRDAAAAQEDQRSVDRLCAAEHDRWMRDRLLKGYEYVPAAHRNDGLRLHPDIVPFAEVPPAHQDYDRAIIASIFAALAEHGYDVVHESRAGAAPRRDLRS